MYKFVSLNSEQQEHIMLFPGEDGAGPGRPTTLTSSLNGAQTNWPVNEKDEISC